MDVDWSALSKRIGLSLDGGSATAQSGGSISSAWRVESDRGPVFIKLEPATQLDRLEAEADGLEALGQARAVRVPSVLGHGASGAVAFLALEWVEAGHGRAAAARLGEQLAALHRRTGTAFGWHRDNFIGATPQANSMTEDWRLFLRERRLLFQYRLAVGKGYRLDDSGMRKLLEGLGAFYDDYRPAISLLHGDLWGGNWFPDEQGQPVIFDPAVYFGDREADIAMSELFGGFGPDFYAAYDSEWPLDPGYPVRRNLHKLYHILNHLNLFGRGYLGQANALIGRLNSELA